MAFCIDSKKTLHFPEIAEALTKIRVRPVADGAPA
jgi:hypothetical protein